MNGQFDDTQRFDAIPRETGHLSGAARPMSRRELREQAARGARSGGGRHGGSGSGPRRAAAVGGAAVLVALTGLAYAAIPSASGGSGSRTVGDAAGPPPQVAAVVTSPSGSPSASPASATPSSSVSPSAAPSSGAPSSTASTAPRATPSTAPAQQPQSTPAKAKQTSRTATSGGAGTTKGGAVPGTPATGTAAQFAQQVVDMVNAERAKAGCGPLAVDAKIQAAAQEHSDDMAARDYYEHDTPEGVSPGTRMTNAGYQWMGWGENIFKSPKDPQTAMTGWMNSPGHRDNILNCSFTHTGVGVNVSSNGPWWTQDFGRS